MMEGPRHQHLHQEWQEPLEEPGCGPAGRRAFAHADTRNTSPGCKSCASAPSPAEENFARRRAKNLAALPRPARFRILLDPLYVYMGDV